MKITISVFVGMLVTLVGWAAESSPAGEVTTTQPSGPDLRVYEFNKKVSEFPAKEDLATPEAAYATFNRAMVTGEDAAWRRISAQRHREGASPDAPKVEYSPDTVKMYLEARLLEARVFKDRAVVMAELTREGKPPAIDIRTFALEEGRWLNLGNDRLESLAAARERASDVFGMAMPKLVRPKIADPAAYLKPFMEHLANTGQEPGAFVMKALADHKLTILGEIHHRPRYWAFDASLVTNPDFPEHVGTIYLELPANDQALVDKFLAGRDCDTQPVIEMLRDMLWSGWPDQATLDFFVTVWRVNHDLPEGRRLRILLVDMQRPWKEIHKHDDWGKYEVDRDKFMAGNILADLKQHPDDQRNALFIVGVWHAAVDLKRPVEGTPMKTAGWHLRQSLGSRVYAIFPHSCVMGNSGQVDGRLCLGLFDSAFAAMGNRPVAFPLDAGPFGKERYDADLDHPGSPCCYRDGFQAYLYLGPLEYEIFSPLIAGFYTDEFVNELNRRARLENITGMDSELAGGESLTASMNVWGRPRMDWSRGNLGPLDAWQRGGSDWREPLRQEKLAYTREHPEVLADAARGLLNAIKTADYNRDWMAENTWAKFLPSGCGYMAHTGFDDWVKWMTNTFKNNPITDVEVGKTFMNEGSLPAVPYRLTLKDGTILKGDLPFDYDPRGEYWQAQEGLDWHLKYPNGLGRPASRPSAPPAT